MIPSCQAIRSLLALKLFGNARHSHVMSSVFDEGLALFAGLNVIPKRSFLTEYSCRIDPGSYPKLMRLWFDAMKPLGLDRGNSFDLDFHTIPFHGEDAWSKSTMSPNAAGVRKASWRFLHRMRAIVSSAMPTHSCARRTRTTRFCALSISGKKGQGKILKS